VEHGVAQEGHFLGTEAQGAVWQKFAKCWQDFAEVWRNLAKAARRSRSERRC
jgi:hypothetical protein